MADDDCWVAGPLSARVADRDGTAEVYLSGEFDLEGGPMVQHLLSNALTAHSRLLLDLSGLRFMDSTGIGVLIRTKHECIEREADMVIRVGSSPVRRVLELVSVTDFLRLED